VLGIGDSIFTDGDAIPCISLFPISLVLPRGVRGIAGGDGILGRGAASSGGGALVHWRFQRVCRFFPVLFWHDWEPSI